MNTLNRFMTNICSTDLEGSKIFYCKLFDFQIEFESDWFIQLQSLENHFEIGIIDIHSEFIPKDFQMTPQGIYLTFVVDNVEVIYDIALKENFKIVQKPMDTSYGQRRLLLEDPNGVLIDISSVINDFNR